MTLFDVTVASSAKRIAERAKELGAYVTTLTRDAHAHAAALASEEPRSTLNGVP